MALDIIDTPIRIGFTDLLCRADTHEWDNDEPYCAMFVMDNRRRCEHCDWSAAPSVGVLAGHREFPDAAVLVGRGNAS
jgi:hypothetical protein